MIHKHREILCKYFILFNIDIILFYRKRKRRQERKRQDAYLLLNYKMFITKLNIKIKSVNMNINYRTIIKSRYD